jgi:23S rRNA (pseudouridine1915-N3)-methyltransferase
MKIKYVSCGKADETYLKGGIEDYARRISHYVPFEHTEIPAIRGAGSRSPREVMAKEAEKINACLSASDYIVILDEKGKEMRSVEFSGFLNQRFSSGSKALVFISGGPFGIDPSVKNRASQVLALSKMTFPHLMVKLFFLEQLYRALTILSNESYHHE